MSRDSRLAELDRYIEDHLQQFIDDLSTLCALPTVSAQGQAIDETAAAVRDLLEKYGVEAEVIPTSGFPVVYGRASGASPRTLLCYNHYDVQPAEPFELWDSPPFEATLRNGKLYARGVADDKGHIVCRLAAIAALRAVYGQLPCSVTFLIEGEEEIGSVSLPPFIEANADRFRADACLWESGRVDYEGRPQMYLGMRGDYYVELRARCMTRDAHSGQGGSIFPNAAWRLVWALNTLKGPDERIRIPGWYDDVRPPSERDLELLAAAPDQDDELRRTYGIREFLLGASGLELKRRQVFEPTCTISGIASGYQGPGSKTVLPAEAMAKVDFRLVPEQRPDDLREKLRRHLVEQGFGDIEIIEHCGYPAARVDPDHPFVQLAAQAAREVYGKDPVIHPLSGGSGPMDPFVRVLRVPIANAGIGYPDSRAHAPNEHIRLSDFVAGVKHTARVMLRLPDLPV